MAQAQKVVAFAQQANIDLAPLYTSDLCDPVSGRALTRTEGELARALAAHNVSCRAVAWTDESVDWSQFAAVLPLSAWDYVLALDAFEAWLARLEHSRTPVVNTPATIRWNARKSVYLPQLAAAGIAMPPTAWIGAAPAGRELTGADLRAAAHAAGLDSARGLVLKPSVSGGARLTLRLAGEDELDTPEALAAARQILGEGHTVVLQQFVPEISDAGETSFIFFDGKLSACMAKLPASGDFRVQADYNGTTALWPDPPAALVAAAQAVLEAACQALGATEPFCYARVDGIVVGGTLVLMELELIEPYLWLEKAPTAAEALAQAVVRRLN